MRGLRFVAFLLTLGAAPISGRAQTPRLVLQPCRLPGIFEELRCGSLEVWENRATRSGRRITLRMVLLPSWNSSPAGDPVVDLEGGPGASAVASAGGFLLSPLRRQRDILLVDARGTGGSNALECDFTTARGSGGYLEDFLPVAGVRECLQQLRTRADLTRYSSLDVVEDIEEVRAALGISRINLFATSGGTRIALLYLRHHPESVRSALLIGPVPVDSRIPLTFARDAQDALDGLFAACRRDAACGGQFPALESRFRAVLARLDSAPVSLKLNGQQVTLSRSGVAQVIRYMLYRPRAAAAIPLVVTQAAEGDFEPLARQAVQLGSITTGVADGLYLSVTCAEDVARFGEAEGKAAAQGTFLGDYRARQQRAACADWPRATLPAGHFAPVRSAVPTLILVGERDPVTPPRWAREIAPGLSRGRVLVIPHGGHSLSGLSDPNCVPAIMQQLVETGAADSLPVSCVATLAPPPFALRLP